MLSLYCDVEHTNKKGNLIDTKMIYIGIMLISKIQILIVLVIGSKSLEN